MLQSSPSARSLLLSDDHDNIRPMINLVRIVTIFLRGVGNPLVFGLYMTCSPRLASVLGTEASFKVDTNVRRINVPLFLFFSFTLYVCGVYLHVALHRAVTRFNARVMFSYAFSPWSLLLSLPGLFNFYVWAWVGMEGNVFGFLFVLPLLITQFLTCVHWIFAMRKGLL